jgi:hypothetical protein
MVPVRVFSPICVGVPDFFMAAVEWNVRPGAKVSTLTGAPFNEGDRIVCLLFATDQPGELGRADLLQQEVETFELRGTLLGRWSRIVKSAADEAKEAQQMTIASAESLFFSLFDEADSEVTPSIAEENPADALTMRELLQHFLALLLERRRILRALGARNREGKQLYRHIKEKRDFEVPIRELSPSAIAQLQDVIGELI